METPDQVAIDRWHRWFAVECNNRAWELTGAESRTPEEEREMLLAAHASVFHWSKVGTAVNAMRGEMLLAHVCALLGEGTAALAHARRCLAGCEEGGLTGFDLAFANLEVAQAAAVAGDAELHARHYAMAQELAAALGDPDDRKIFDAAFTRVPAPA